MSMTYNYFYRILNSWFEFLIQPYLKKFNIKESLTN